MVSAHGTYSRYVNYRCRCGDCREANRTYRARHRRRVVEAFWRGETLVRRHGRSGYDQGCRCDDCRAGHNTARKANKARQRQAGGEA